MKINRILEIGFFFYVINQKEVRKYEQISKKNRYDKRLSGLNKDQLRKLAEDDNYIKFISATIIGNEVIERIVKRDILKEGGESEN